MTADIKWVTAHRSMVYITIITPATNNVDTGGLWGRDIRSHWQLNRLYFGVISRSARGELLDGVNSIVAGWWAPALERLNQTFGDVL